LNIGSATDAYQPIERDLKLTQQILHLLQAFRHPFSMVTKSAAIELDLQILADMAKDNLVAIYITITTLAHEFARKL
jgi:DNA repair photolyase